MANPEITKLINDFKDRIKSAPESNNSPDTYWIAGIGSTVIVPQAGNLWINYQVEEQVYAQVIEVEGETTTPIQPGKNLIAVNEFDSVYYQLNNPSTDQIGFAYQIEP